MVSVTDFLSEKTVDDAGFFCIQTFLTVEGFSHLSSAGLHRLVEAIKDLEGCACESSLMQMVEGLTRSNALLDLNRNKQKN